MLLVVLFVLIQLGSAQWAGVMLASPVKQALEVKCVSTFGLGYRCLGDGFHAD